MKCCDLIWGALGLLGLILLGLMFCPQAAAEEDVGKEHVGKQTFLAQKCEVCHSVSSQGIAHTSKVAKLVGPDLDDVADRREVSWMTRYVKREQVGDNGKKHAKPFKGTDEELQTILDWLVSLKAEPQDSNDSR